MNDTKRLLIRFQQRTKSVFRKLVCQRQTLNGLKNSPLGNLPTELLQEIANSLSVASAASFSLSCRHIYFLLGTRYLEEITTSSRKTLAFLKLLEHDLQNHIVCNSCRRLHTIEDAKKCIKNRYTVLPLEVVHLLSVDEVAMVRLYMYETLSTTVCKIAQKHCRAFCHDSRRRQLLNLLSQKPRTTSWGIQALEQEEAECQIKNGSLFTCKRVAFHGMCRGIERDSSLLEICPHQELESKLRSAGLHLETSYPRSRKKWSVSLHGKKSTDTNKTSWDLYSELQRCQYCPTRYRFSFEHRDGRAVKKFIHYLERSRARG